MSNRAINAIGFLLGAAAVGIPIGIHLARKLRVPATQNHSYPAPANMKGGVR